MSILVSDERGREWGGHTLTLMIISPYVTFSLDFHFSFLVLYAPFYYL